MHVRPLTTLTLLALTSCAMSHAMPPFGVAHSTTVAAAPESPARTLPAARTFAHRKHIAREHDAATDQTRISVTTHRGSYFLWIQHPRLTFFYEYQGTAPAEAPGSVFLVFRTQNPQVPASNRLSVACDGTNQDLAITPSFSTEPSAFTSNRLYMYELSLDQLAQVVACRAVTIAVGDVSAPFNAEQMEALRDFAAGVRAR